MAQFPQDTSNILTLAGTMVEGLKDNDSVFPSPPVAADDLQALRDAAAAACAAQVAAQAAAKAATEQKHIAMSKLTAAMKNDIVYAEITVQTPAELGLIGWGPRAEPTPLALPSQPLGLKIANQDADGLKLDWKKPKSGGKVAFYRVEMRTVDPAAGWALKGTATTTKIELLNLPPGTALEFRIIAENAAGEGMPSNTVTATL